MREDIAGTRAPHLANWTGADIFFQHGEEPVDGEGLPCSRVDSVQAQKAKPFMYVHQLRSSSRSRRPLARNSGLVYALSDPLHRCFGQI
jgi:hypothetical protein